MIENNILSGNITANPVGGTLSNNILPPTDPLFVDATNNNYQLRPTSPAIAAGLIVPPYTNGYSGSAPDIGAYDHAKPAWKAGAQASAIVSAPSYAPTLTPGTVAVIEGFSPFDSGSSVMLTDGANVDLPAPVIYLSTSPPQLAFRVPAGAAPGVAMIAVTNGDGTISLSSAPLFAGAPPIAISATQGSGQSATIETTFSNALQATVKDSSGSPVDGVAVMFSLPTMGAGGSFAGSATVTTNSLGVASAPVFTANGVAGSYTVTASAAGVGTLASFNLTNNRGVAYTVIATRGSGQNTPINTVFAVTLQAAVKDVGGNGIPGEAVTFAAPTAGAGGAFTGSATAVTDSSGVATSPPFTANGLVGAYNVTASVAGITSAATFTLTNTTADPTVNPGGIVPVNGAISTIQPGEWVTIYGMRLTGLAGATAVWAGDFPTSLAGVSVSIDGKAAYLSYVSPGQINLQAPDDAATGPVPVVVTTANGSVTSAVTLAPIAPSFLLLDDRHVAGIILRADGSGAYGGGTYDVLGPTGTSLGYKTVAARPGDIVEIFGVGFGPTSPFVPAGQVFSGSAPSVNPVSFLVGNVSLMPTFAGLSSAGLFQINLRIPSGLGGGDIPIVATAGGIKTPGGVVISLQM